MNEPRIPGSPRLHEMGGIEEQDVELNGAVPARDTVVVRSLEEEDADRVVRVDARIMGRDRRAYFKRIMAQALRESGVRLSLVAERDGVVVGFVMAHVDYGDFGQAGATAMVDTIGVDPDASGAHVGRALLSQLVANLGALRVETVRTEIEWSDFALAGFLDSCGFAPAQRLSFTLPLD